MQNHHDISVPTGVFGTFIGVIAVLFGLTVEVRAESYARTLKISGSEFQHEIVQYSDPSFTWGGNELHDAKIQFLDEALEPLGDPSEFTPDRWIKVPDEAIGADVNVQARSWLESHPNNRGRKIIGSVVFTIDYKDAKGQGAGLFPIEIRDSKSKSHSDGERSHFYLGRLSDYRIIFPQNVASATPRITPAATPASMSTPHPSPSPPPSNELPNHHEERDSIPPISKGWSSQVLILAVILGGFAGLAVASIKSRS